MSLVEAFHVRRSSLLRKISPLMGLSLLAWWTPNTALAEALVYLNFDGVTLAAPAMGEGENAAQLKSELAARLNKSSIVIPPAQFSTQFPREIVVSLIVADVQKHYQGLGLRLVTEKPIDDRYTMIVIGGKADALGGGLEREYGWGTTDCDDQNPRNVGFVFSETINGSGGDWDTTQVAATVSQELAHTFGLEHIDGPDDLLLRPVPAKVSAYRFSDQCLPVVPGPAVGPSGPGCKTNVGCPEKQQNDRALLKKILGEKMQPGGGPGMGTGDSTGAGPGGGTTGTQKPMGNPGDTPGDDGGCRSAVKGQSGLWGYGVSLAVLLSCFGRRKRR